MALNDVKACCDRLNSDKITERKKAADQLKHLLNNDNIVSSLCSLSKSQRSNSHFNWDLIFLRASQFLIKESEKLEKVQRTKENPSSITLNNWANAKRIALALPKLVLKKSCQGVPHVGVDSLLDFVSTILSRQRPFLLEQFGGDAIQIIHRYLLSFPQYYMHVSLEKWKEDLIRIVIWIYDNNAENLDLKIVVGVIEGILKVFRQSKNTCPQICSPSVLFRPLPNFLCRAILSPTTDKQYGLQRALLSLLCTVCFQFGSQWRSVLCSLGEETMDSVLGLWENKGTPAQQSLLTYLNFQLIIHFPQQGGVFLDRNEFASNSEVWKRKLRQVYLLIFDYLNEVATNCRLGSTSYSKENVPDELVTLAARLFSQIFNDYDDVASLDVTEIGATQRVTQSTQRSKRRRIEIGGFVSVCDMLREEGIQEGAIPWYSIICKMLRDHRQFFASSRRAEYLLDLFLSLLPQCKTNIVMEEIFACLIEMTDPSLFSTSDDNLAILEKKWTRVADLTTRFVAGKQCGNSGMKLLRSLIINSLVGSQTSLYRLFVKGVFPLNEDGLKLLETLLLTHPIPKNVKTEDSLSFKEETIEDPRICLIMLLLPLKQELELSEQMDTTNLPVKNPSQLANVLALLKLQNPLKAQRTKSVNRGSSMDSREKSQEEVLEYLLLKSLFSFKTASDTEYSFDYNVKNLKSLEDVESILINRMKQFIEEYVNNCVASDLQNDVFIALNICQMSVYLWPLLADKRLVAFIPKLKPIFEHLEQVLSPASNSSSPWNVATGVFEKMNLLFITAIQVSQSHSIGDEYFQSVLDAFPLTFQETCLRFVRSRVLVSPDASQSQAPPTISQAISSNVVTHHSYAADTSFDDDFDDLDSMMSTTVSEDWDIKNEDTETEIMNSNRIEREFLPPKDQLILLVVEWLAKVYELTMEIDLSADNEDLPFVQCVKVFFTLAESEKIEDQIMAVVCISVLFNAKYHEDNVTDGLELISTISGKNATDSRFILGSLKRLKELLSLNGLNLQSKDKTNILHLIKIIAGKLKKGLYGLDVSEQMFEIVVEFTKIDSLRSWSWFTVDGDNRISQLYNQMRSPYHDMRMKSVANVALLFEQDKNPLPLEHQRKMFAELYQIALESLCVEAKLDPHFVPDERSCRVASFLCCLCSVANSSPAMESHALYALISSCKVNNIIEDFVIKATRSIVSVAQHPDLTTYLVSHLPFLVFQWVKDKHPLHEFPFLMLECFDMNTFGWQYCKVIVPVLFTLDEGLKEVGLLAQSMAIEIKTLIEENFAPIMAVILPYLVASSSLQESGQKPIFSKNEIASATRKWKYIESILGSEQLISHIANDIGDVILNLLRLGHDLKCWHEEDLVVPPPHFYFDVDTVITTLSEAHLLFFKDKSSVLSLLCEHKYHIHSVLHSLFTDVLKSVPTRSIRVRQALVSFDIVVKGIIHLVGCHLQSMEYYIVRKLVRMTTHLIVEFSSDQPKMAVKCCEILHDFILACLNAVSATQVLITTLPSVVSRLHSLHCKTSVWNAVYTVLLLLFSSRSEPLGRALSILFHFPANRNDSKLDHLFTLQRNLIEKYQGNISLIKKVDNFIKMPPAEITSYDIQDIFDLLTEKKHEIPDLYKPSLSGEPLAAHSFIHKLLSFISRANNSEEGFLALDCLGKLGPLDLATFVFAVQSHNDRAASLMTKGNDDRRIVINIITALNRLTFSGHLPAVEASVMALGLIISQKKYYETVQKCENTNLCHDLIPFYHKKRSQTVTREFQGFDQRISDVSLWKIDKDFGDWVSTLTIALIEAGCEDDFFNHLIPVCRVEVNFCQLILPYAFHNLLKEDIHHRRPILSRMVTHLVEELCCQKFISGNRVQTENKTVIRSALRLILEVINYLRTKDSRISFSNRDYATEWDRNLWLDLDFLLLAKASFHCGSLFSAVLFVEIACDLYQEKWPPSSQDERPSMTEIQRRQLPPLQRIATSAEGKEMSALLLQVYSALGAVESVEGCGGVSLITDFLVQSTVSLHRGQNIQALGLSDAAGAERCLLKGLRTCGLYNVLHRMSSSSHDLNSKLNLDIQAECAWRLSNWDESVEVDPDTSFHPAFLKALSHLKNKDESSFIDTKKAFYQSTLLFLKENGNESTSEIYPVLSHLQIFSELSEIFRCALIKSEDEFSSRVVSLLSSWEEKESFGSIKDQEKEQILAARISALKALPAIKEEKKVVVQQILFNLLLKKCELGNLTQRCRALHEAQGIKTSPKEEWKLKLEEVKFAVSLNNNSQAICALDNLIRDIEHNSTDDDTLKYYYNVLILYGQVLVKSRTRSPRVVIESYYGKAISLIEARLGRDCGFLENCYAELASFGDKLYQEINMSLSSDHSQSRKQQMDKSELEITRLRELINVAKRSLKTKDEDLKYNNKKLVILERDVTREKKDFESQENEAEDYLCLALENYLKVLASSSKFDLSVYRVVALWLENVTKERPNNLVHEYISRIQSHKFIPLLYQLVARLTNVQDPSKHHVSFPQTLNTILENVCCQHPHHGLPVVLMLAGSHLDEELKQMSKGGRGNSKCKSSTQEAFVEEDRVKAAKRLIESLKKIPSLTNHISELEMVFLAYITLANQKIQMSVKNPLTKLQNLEYTSPLTRPIPVQPSSSYSVPLIAKWLPKIELVGGINAPLKLTLLSSDGLESRELLKGNDDLRQDAVLEQVFNVVNKLLRNDAEAKKQNLSIKTYLVVPLSQKTGLIQWCDNTKVLGDYLPVMHKKYYPQDFDANVCRKMIERPRIIAANSQKTSKKSLEQTLIETMEDILANFHPVFRFFFYEQYPSPEKWYSHRCSYTHSVATSSIAGYILGLGDRHVRNLLLDVNTAEIIHIDLGISFENGKLLPTPERVPFRMTQDIVDGLGAMGIEGPLRKNMETTLRVFRESKSVFLTIVEVLRHDPLHQWTLTPSQIAKLRLLDPQEVTSNEDSNSASMAERALIRVQQKLNGLEDGLVLSVEDHVSVLLQQATDISNLAQMFNGWQQYL